MTAQQTKPAQQTKAFRLPTHVRPERYTLALSLDPTRSRRYRGQVAIDVQLDKPVDAIELHAVDLTISRAQVTTSDALKKTRARVRMVPEHETVRVELGRALRGRVTLHLSFRGAMRSDLRGLYFAQSGTRKYAFTQLEAADARRFFPCFDEPSFKARFALEVTTRRSLQVISNARQAARSLPAKGLQTVRFEETPLLSTYLVALAVGELKSSAVRRAGRVPIRVLHAPMRGAAGMTRFALDAAAACLVRLERYFGVPYPYDKLDLVAVPDFEMGAMENAGAVFFRETLLLIDDKRATLPEKKRAIEVICHELAHMWYGNLVTMAWWDDLWLNEAFATWMAFEIVDQWQPSLRMWNDFGHARSSALALDALRSTHAIYTPVRTAADATESFDLITYEKGAAVIRMLERYLGPERFRAGVRDYIRRHAEGNATADDLWRALERHAGDDVARVVRPWIERPGFPLVRVASKRAGRGTQLRLSQERFVAAGPGGARDKQQAWPVPMVVRALGPGDRLARTVLSGRTATLALLTHKPVYANADEGGFYHPLHAPEDFSALLANIAQLSTAERLGLVTHTWALASAGYTPIERMLELSDALSSERDPDVLAALSGPLSVLVDRVASAAGPGAVSALQQRIARAFLPPLQRLGYGPKRGKREPLEHALRRTELLEIVAGIAEQPEAIAQARALGARYFVRPGSVEPNLGGLALTLASRHADLAQHKRLLQRSEQAGTPQEKRRFRMALAEARDVSCIERTLKLCTTPKIPTQDVAIMLCRLCDNPAARAVMFARLQEDWPSFAKRLTPALAGRFVEATRALQTDVRPSELLAFLGGASLPGTKRALAQLKERLTLDTALRARAKRELARYAR